MEPNAVVQVLGRFKNAEVWVGSQQGIDKIGCPDLWENTSECTILVHI